MSLAFIGVGLAVNLSGPIYDGEPLPNARAERRLNVRRMRLLIPKSVIKKLPLLSRNIFAGLMS